MSALFFSVAIATAGTPQQLSRATAPSLPTISMGGVTSPSGSMTEHGNQITIQANPANTGNVYIGGAALNKATLSNVGLVLTPTSPPVSLASFGGAITLDDLWADTATNGNIVLVTLVG